VAVPISLAPPTVAIPGVMHIGTPVGASAAVIDPQPDTRRLLTDDDITHGVRLASTIDADVIVSTLLSSFRTTYTREELTHIVGLILDVLRDTCVFLRERISVARLREELSDDILNDIMRQLLRYVGGRPRE